MKQDYIRLFDRFTHGTMSRRAFLKRLNALAGSAAAAAAILPLLENNYALAALVSEDDPDIKIARPVYSAEDVEISGYMAWPAEAAGSLPGVLVIHENRGLNPHIEDVTRRLAKEGFLAFAPDMLSPLGGTPEDSDQARDMIGSLNSNETLTRLMAGYDFLKGQAIGNGKVGAIGFCWGGGMTNALAVNVPTLSAAVPYYGRQPDPADVLKIKAPVLAHYGGLDERINGGIPAFEGALTEAGVEHHIYIYEGANHAFNNDTNAARYDKAAAHLAWQRTIDFLKEKLG